MPCPAAEGWGPRSLVAEPPADARWRRRTSSRQDRRPSSRQELQRAYLTNGVSGVGRLVGLGGRPAVTERDGEGVDHGLPAHRPPGAACPGRVQAAGHKIQALQCGLLAGEVAAGPDRAPVAGVQGFDRIRGADHLPDFGVVVEERNEFVPCVAPQPDHRAIFITPFLLQFVQRRGRRVRVGCGIDGPDVPLDRVHIPAWR